RGFLDTRGVHLRSAARPSGPVRNLLREARETLRGTFEAPLRYALSPRADGSLQALDPATRRDIGA
ncbi:MAG TPA: hypothetical protein VLS27_08410, partial [Gammaproteobacteria bacterium]|nr:hypothetical protein [Gammaproteobacteria bacterium]